MGGGDYVRRDADSFWRFAQQMSQEVRAWPSWKLKAAADAFCSPQREEVRHDTKSRESTPKPVIKADASP
jgi:hypothetical protein